MKHRGIICGLLAGMTELLLGPASTLSAQTRPWWDDYPLIIENADAATVQRLHADASFQAQFGDPSWGIYAQRAGASGNKPKLLHDAGLKYLSYYEAFGESTSYLIQLGSQTSTGEYSLHRTYWNWSAIDPNTAAIRWTGPQNYFDAEDFCGPYTRLHPVYGAGGRPMTYPDGAPATGYFDADRSDPRKSRVHDASASKSILGTLSIHYNTLTNVPPNRQGGLIPVDGALVGHMSIGKDTACPLWIDQQRSSVLYSVGEGGVDGVWCDNFSPWDNFGYPPVAIAFGDWSVAKFRDYLAARFTSAQLASMGVTNPATYDVRTALRARLTTLGGNSTNLADPWWNHRSWLDDPVWRAYMIFKRQTGTEALDRYYAATKDAAAQAGRPDFPVMGNDIPVFSLGYCRGNLDVVSSELSPGWHMGTSSRGFMMPPVGRFAPAYKLGREHAKSRLMNVWMYLSGANAAYKEKPGAMNTLYYEMLANHALPMLHSGHPDTTQDEAINGGFFGFVRNARASFGGRNPLADVGIYYSTSSLLTFMTPKGFLDMENQPHSGAYNGWGTALGTLHYQYRPIPEWKLTAEALAELRVFIISHAEVLDAADVAGVIEPWVRAGGRLIVTGNSGRRRGESGNFEPYAELSLAGLTGVAGDATAPATKLSAVGNGTVYYIKDNFGLSYFSASTASARAGLIGNFATAMSQVLGAEPMILTPATSIPGTVGLNVYEDSAARRLFLDANNYDVNLTTDAVTPSPAMTVTIRAPAWLASAPAENLRVQVLSPTTPAPVIKISKSGSDRIQVELGAVTHYASVVVTADPGKLVNLSVRTTAGTAAQTLIVGFVVAGTPDQPLLLRGIGPSLAPFGVTGFLADPSLQLFAGPTLLAANDNWSSPASGTAASVAAAFAAAGAFSLPASSLDAALVRTVGAGSYSVQIGGASATSGVALAEIYDRSSAASGRLANLSARAEVGAGTVIVGFTIAGQAPLPVLVRAIGPTLGTSFGVDGALANPRLDLFRGATLVASNDDWDGSATLATASTRVGAFALPADSRDAALLVTLAPGSYTAQTTGVGGTTGIALVEVYDLP